MVASQPGVAVTYEIRAFEGAEADWPHYVRVHNLAWPEYPTTVAEAVSEADRWDEAYRRSRFLMERDGEVIGFGVWCDCSWSPRKGKYFVDWFTDPAHGETAEGFLGSFLLAEVEKLGDLETLCAETREDQPRVGWLEARGFKLVHREACSEINPQEFDDAPFTDKIAAIEAGPYEIIDQATLTERMDDWFERLYDLNVALLKDLPAPEPLVPESRERFRARLNRPGHDPHAYFVAMHGERCIGLSTLGLALAEPHKLYVGLTGVRREYRRQGLCTAMKVRALQWAREAGYTQIVTDNEENNPMYQINLALGFRPTPAWVAFQTGDAPVAHG